MRMLLDTHAFIWFIQGDPRLSALLRAAIEHPSNTKLVSVASVWEMAIKQKIGKLELDEPLEELLDRELSRFEVLPISVRHAVGTAALPLHHRDPFDRILIAQSLADDLTIVSVDADFDAYGVQRVW